MNLAEIIRVSGNLKKNYDYHKEQSRYYLQLFNQYHTSVIDLDAVPSPLIQFYQLTAEYHATQMFVLDQMFRDYHKAVDSTLFE